MILEENNISNLKNANFPDGKFSKSKELPILTPYDTFHIPAACASVFLTLKEWQSKHRSTV